MFSTISVLYVKRAASFVKIRVDALRSFVLLKYKFLYMQFVVL